MMPWVFRIKAVTNIPDRFPEVVRINLTDLEALEVPSRCIQEFYPLIQISWISELPKAKYIQGHWREPWSHNITRTPSARNLGHTLSQIYPIKMSCLNLMELEVNMEPEIQFSQILDVLIRTALHLGHRCLMVLWLLQILKVSSL